MPPFNRKNKQPPNESNLQPQTFSEPSTPKYKIINTNVAGVSYRKSDIIGELCSENPEYEYSKRELKELYPYGETIYKYDISYYDAILEPEPTNEYDPNAIKVIIDGLHVGYIKKGSCTRIKTLMDTNKIHSIDAEITGGPYKRLEYDDDEDIYYLEKSSLQISIKLEIKVLDLDDTKGTENTKNTANANKTENTNTSPQPDYFSIYNPPSLKCPKCSSSNIQAISDTQSKGVRFCKLCSCGLFGLCRARKTQTKHYWKCQSCGNKFKM